MSEIRRTWPCRYCGYEYKSRGIYGDHALAEHNLALHEDSCLEQQRRKVEKEKVRRLRRLGRAVRKNKALPGQLGFPFEGVLGEVE